MNTPDKYLNFESNTKESLIQKLGINIEPNVQMYDKHFQDYVNDPKNICLHIHAELKSWINKKYNMINIHDADVNYYIESICAASKCKFSEIIEQLNISHLISMIDYSDKANANTNTNTKYSEFRNEYYNKQKNIKKVCCKKHFFVF